jgi:hypothetical protein
MLSGLKENMLNGAFELPSKGDALFELAIDYFLGSFFLSSWLSKKGCKSYFVSLARFLGEGLFLIS